jgi:hypothetical protein
MDSLDIRRAALPAYGLNDRFGMLGCLLGVAVSMFLHWNSCRHQRQEDSHPPGTSVGKNPILCRSASIQASRACSPLLACSILECSIFQIFDVVLRGNSLAQEIELFESTRHSS